MPNLCKIVVTPSFVHRKGEGFSQLSHRCVGMAQSQKRPDVHKFVFSIKLRFPPQKSVNFENFLLICTVFPCFGPFSGGEGGKPNFADKNFMDTQTLLKRGSEVLNSWPMLVLHAPLTAAGFAHAGAYLWIIICLSHPAMPAPGLGTTENASEAT